MITVAPMAIQIFAFQEAEKRKTGVSKVRTQLEKKIEKERQEELKQQEVKLPKEEKKRKKGNK